MSNPIKIAEKLVREHDLTDHQLLTLITHRDEETKQYLKKQAQALCQDNYGKNIYIRGLIEYTNYCKNDCYYCGIRRSNEKAERYRLTKEEILSCCETGYELGFRTFVLQGGEDAYYNDERLCDVITSIKRQYPDCAVTLSSGERSKGSYQRLFDAGANRYLLRHETATPSHYQKLHPPGMSLESRMKCLNALKEIGFQTGCGFMVGSPYQTTEDIVRDLRFTKDFSPHMIGIGPYISHKDTPFHDKPDGSAEFTLYLLSIIRLLLPQVLLPATTALGTVMEDGRTEGILHGANVVMPNLSPANVRQKYMLYNNKRSTGSEAAECIGLLKESLSKIDYEIAITKGDSLII